MRYFAYGSNMSRRIFSKVCPSYKVIGPAKIKNYRLAFTRISKKYNGTGVADIINAPKLVVWGVLYEIDEKDVRELDRKEDLGRAYTKINVDATLKNGDVIKAMTYTVISKESYDIKPSEEYIDLLVEGAEENKLNKNYIDYLKSLFTYEERWSQKGLLVFPTESRKKAGGMNLLKISKSISKKIRLGSYAVAVYGNKSCLVKVVHENKIFENSCQVDQTVRSVLGFPDRECFGIYFLIFPVRRNKLPFSLVKPRSLTLSISRPSIYHSEKKICILHEDNIKLLGLNEGEYVKIYAASLNKKQKYKIRKCTLRAFTGSKRKLKREEELAPYPMVNKVYVDFDGRFMLGITRNNIDVPIVVTANVGRLFSSRLLYYGITLFLGFIALTPLLKEIVGKFDKVTFALAFIFSALITFFLCVFDVRGKVQY